MYVEKKLIHVDQLLNFALDNYFLTLINHIFYEKGIIFMYVI